MYAEYLDSYLSIPRYVKWQQILQFSHTVVDLHAMPFISTYQLSFMIWFSTRRDRESLNSRTQKKLICITIDCGRGCCLYLRKWWQYQKKIFLNIKSFFIGNIKNTAIIFHPFPYDKKKSWTKRDLFSWYRIPINPYFQLHISDIFLVS